MDFNANFFVAIFIGGAVVTSIFLITFFGLRFKYSDCFEEIAKEVCQEKGEFFHKISFGRIACGTDPRELMDYNYYRFLDEEIERCRK